MSVLGRLRDRINPGAWSVYSGIGTSTDEGAGSTPYGYSINPDMDVIVGRGDDPPLTAAGNPLHDGQGRTLV